MWKFPRAVVVIELMQDPSVVNLGHPMIDGAHIGCPGPDDPSYSFFSGFLVGLGHWIPEIINY